MMRWLRKQFMETLVVLLYFAVLFYLWASFAQHNHLLTPHQTWASFNHFLNGCAR